MNKILFCIVFWAAFFFLRAFFKQHGLPLDDRLWNIGGAALFLILVLLYLLLAALFRAYFSGGAEASTRPPRKLPMGRPEASRVKTAPAAPAVTTPQPDSEPSKKSRVRVIGGGK